MHIIAIVPEHLWIIEFVNGGIPPIVEEGPTKFFYEDENGYPHIVIAPVARALFPRSLDYIALFSK